MKAIFIQYKPFFLFLGRFLLVYLSLLLVYKIYLNRFDFVQNEPDSMTVLVAEQSNGLMIFFGYESRIEPNPSEPSINLYHGPNNYYVRVIEGCNAVSVMILFAAFCFAFSAYFLRTLIYVLIGFVLIHFLNVFRIALIVVLSIKYPQWYTALHDIVFPLFIYGVVFILWCLWLFKFSGYAEKFLTKK